MVSHTVTATLSDNVDNEGVGNTGNFRRLWDDHRKEEPFQSSVLAG